MSYEIYNKLKAKFDKNGYFYWYKIKKDDVVLIAKGSTRTDAKNNLLERVKNKEKYQNQLVFKVKIELIEPEKIKKPLINGIIAIHVDAYKISKKYALVDTDVNLTKTVWVPTDQYDKFKFEDVKKIIKLIHERKIDLNPLNVTTINDIKKGKGKK